MDNKPHERIIGIVGALKECETKEHVEDIFGKFAVTDLVVKTRYLKECMGNPEIFFQTGLTTMKVPISPFGLCL